MRLAREALFSEVGVLYEWLKKIRYNFVQKKLDLQLLLYNHKSSFRGKMTLSFFARCKLNVCHTHNVSKNACSSNGCTCTITLNEHGVVVITLGG